VTNCPLTHQIKEGNRTGEGNSAETDRGRGGGIRIRFARRRCNAQNLCWAFWSSSFDRTRYLDLDRNERRQGIRQLGSEIHDHWIDSFRSLCGSSEPVTSSAPICGATCHWSVDPSLVWVRVRPLLRGTGDGRVKVELDISRLGESRWYEHLLRFVFGGTVTALAGLIAKHYGPIVGGLFLAFPAIFPAAASLIEKHEKARKQRQGMDGTQRARIAVGLDAAGAAIGSIGLITFAAIVWRVLPNSSLSVVLPAAMLGWAATCIVGWMGWQFLRRRGRIRRQHSSRGALNTSIRTGRAS